MIEDMTSQDGDRGVDQPFRFFDGCSVELSYGGGEVENFERVKEFLCQSFPGLKVTGRQTTTGSSTVEMAAASVRPDHALGYVQIRVDPTTARVARGSLRLFQLIFAATHHYLHRTGGAGDGRT